MNKHFRLYIYTFFGVGLTIFLIGFVGINLSLKYIQNKYIQLQIDVNQRQAEQMAFFIEKQLQNGLSQDSVQHLFQEAILGTETDKGFLCMYDYAKDELICHPDKNAIGVKFNKEFIFENPAEGRRELITDLYKQKQGAGGIFIQSSMRTDIIYTVPVPGTNWFVNAHENINVISAEIKILRERYIMGSLILGLLIALAATFTARSISRSYEKEIEQKNIELDKNYSELKILHEQVNEQKSEIEAQRDFVLEQNVEIASKNKQITDSINYAQKIQTAVLPSLPTLNKIIPQNFVLYLPKDIVSGDFYWFTSINNKSILVAADCTGHGVPGAFMSMLGVTLLNEIVNNRHILQADEILNELRRQVKAALNQDGDTGEQKDGMDISLCILDNEKNELEFAGAYNSLYLIRKEENQTDFQLHEVKADHMPIGVHPKDNLPFTKSTISIQDNDVIYLFSDGYVSQFGSDKNEKFKTKRLQQALLAIQKYEIQEQKNILEKILLEWKGERQQVDDILIIGIKI